MKQGTWKSLAVVAAVLMAAVAVVAVALGGCSKMIECSGGYMPMKCHWTYIAVAYVGAAGAVTALVGAFQKETAAKRVAAIAVALAALVAALVISPAGIGTCAHADSQCNQTALVEYALCAVSLVLSLVLAAKADARSAARPKARL